MNTLNNRSLAPDSDGRTIARQLVHRDLVVGPRVLMVCLGDLSVVIVEVCEGKAIGPAGVCLSHGVLL